MRKVELKEVDDLGNTPVQDSELIVQILKTPSNPQQGINYDEMRKVVPLMDKVEKANESVILEEAEWEELCKRTKNFKFATASRGLLDFMDRVVNAKEYELPKSGS